MLLLVKLREWFIANYWRNGGRLNLIMALALLAVAALTVPAFINAFRPSAVALTFDTPYDLHTTVVRQGEPIIAEQEVCNYLDEPMEILSVGSWVALEGGDVLKGPTLRYTAEPGCVVRLVSIPTFSDETPLPLGGWIRIGSLSVLLPPGVPPILFQSEPFEVVP